MKAQPTAYLEDITAAERLQIQAILKKNTTRMGLIYVPPALLCLGALVYTNTNAIKLGLGNSENILGGINVALVVAIALTLRLFVSYLNNGSKELKSWQKKIIQGKINGKKGNSVFIGNQQVKLDAVNAASVKEGDDVEISQTIITGMILSVKKRN